MLRAIGGTLAALLFTTPGPGPQDKPHGQPPAQHSVTFAFKDLDVDGDGKVTREEYMESFRRLDRNQDGVLTAEELPVKDAHSSKDKSGKSKPGKRKARR
ncbi:MAG TPA: hypothetical protein VE981_06930 [Planctomycetota bacterium]|nr:hypothetical protein [Planctomycetota bacterium]